MHTFRLLTLAACAALVWPACQKGTESDKTRDEDKPAPTEGAARAKAANTGHSNPHGGAGGNKQEIPPMSVEAAPEDAKSTPSGIRYVVLEPGKGGDKPGRNDTTEVNYTVWKTTGQTVFSTNRRGKAQTMSLPMIPDGWSEMLRDMTVNEKRMVWMPASLAMRGGGPNKKETYVFSMELVSVQSAPPVPEDVAGPPSDAVKTKSGLAYRVLEKGDGGDTPRAWDQVTVNYTGWDTTGRMFESTVTRKRPRSMSPYKEAPGWGEIIGYMTKGQKTRVWMPKELLSKRPNMPDGTAVYDVELVGFKKMTDPPPVPKNVVAPPKSAKKTEKGVFYKVVKKGKGKKKPTADNRVKVHYTGWTTNGNMFDSSVIAGKPAEFSLRQVIAGWTDGLQVMVEGETTRFWIPVELAYKGQPGRPEGMLVFDIELLEILAANVMPKRPSMISPHGKSPHKPAPGKPGGAHGKPAAK